MIGWKEVSKHSWSVTSKQYHLVGERNNEMHFDEEKKGDLIWLEMKKWAHFVGEKRHVAGNKLASLVDAMAISEIWNFLWPTLNWLTHCTDRDRLYRIKKERKKERKKQLPSSGSHKQPQHQHLIRNHFNLLNVPSLPLWCNETPHEFALLTPIKRGGRRRAGPLLTSYLPIIPSTTTPLILVTFLWVFWY